MPLTERILAAFPGRAWEWMLVWGLLVMARPFINTVVLQAAGYEELAQGLLQRNVPTHLVLAYVVIVLLLGTRMLWRGARDLVPVIRRLTVDAPEPPRASRALGSAAGPLLVAAGIALTARAQDLVTFPLAINFFDFFLLLFITVPVATFAWTYGALLLSADQLGRHTLTLERFPEDRSLGLRPIGALAFNGFWVFTVALIPYLLAGARSAVDFALGYGFFAFVLIAFVLSLWRLHRTMAAAKKDYVEEARALYLAAYEPIRRDPSLPVLEQQAVTLQAAEAIEKRAESILEWPIDERIFARLAVIVTGVVTSLIAALIIASAGIGR